MEPSQHIREERTRLGLTQSELAHRAGVSLPTIQNIEAGRANPSLATLNAVLDALDLRLEIEARPVDWDRLAACGTPLMVREGTAELEPTYASDDLSALPDAETLLASLRHACRELHGRPAESADQRKREAVHSLLLALKLHFPSFFEKHLAGVEMYEEVLSDPISGRTIRMTRQAASALARYL
jgi:transcriptional regulator with XRE-family HTH domain